VNSNSNEPSAANADVTSSSTPYVERLTIRNYRGIEFCEVELEPRLTVLAGRNNAGKSRIISALQLALGGRSADVDDFSVGIDVEPEIDVIFAPGVPDAAGADEEFQMNFTQLFDRRVQPITETPLRERLGWRTRVSRSAEGTGARSESSFLIFNAVARKWDQETAPGLLTSRQRRAFAVDLINTGRDLRDELGRQGSNIRRVLADLEIPDAEREPLETQLSALSARILDGSQTLRSVSAELARLHSLVGSVGSPALNPLPGNLEELGRLISIDLDTGAGPLPIRFHGAGSRSLSSLQVQGVLYERRLGQDGSAVPPTPITLVEEPEAHLHPQAAMELAELLHGMRGQKVVSTHSAHLVTSVDPASIRLIQVVQGATKIVDLGPASSDETATHRAFRPSLHKQEMEKLRRLVERPFGELLFSSCIVIGDGATERAFLPGALRHALGGKSHGVVVIDPGSLANDLASAAVKYSAMTNTPCFIFADSDNDGVSAVKSLEQLDVARPPFVVWINGVDDVGAPVAGAIEAMLHSFDPDMCLAACQIIRPGITGSPLKQMKQLKGSSGTFLARALIEHHPDWRTWPAPLQELIRKLEDAI
jgi:putative ATP-dependent endonuclease of OLD family